MVRFLTLEEAVELHRRVSANPPSASGIRDRGQLEATLAAPQATWGGQYLYEAYSEMAAAYFHGFITAHPFVDANKRVAIASAKMFLDFNGWTLTFKAHTLQQIALQCAESKCDRGTLALMIASNMTALDDPDRRDVIPLLPLD